ncbi:uncharacterized protein LOC119264785 [Pygocentrus nattereri]|uniref:uncharacterized protein LOC119264785 n=1 Tax=Pygocentrus nattereri TaxID=42514 RepID=UPI0018913DE7|nr:uncharacterized protein LOC119264785 [Pygocentrus nattereri]
MGSKKSKPDDEQHLLGDTDDEITVLFDKIKIVLIGCQKAGKNKIGNAILGKNAFTYLNTRKEHYLKDDNTIFGRRITLIRVPGWSQDLSSDDIKQFKIQQVIKDSVKSFKDGPHAILLVVKRNTTLTETTRETLEKLLGSNVSEHMLVFSIDGAKISFATMIDHCAERRQTTIDRCKKDITSLGDACVESKTWSYYNCSNIEGGMEKFKQAGMAGGSHVFNSEEIDLEDWYDMLVKILSDLTEQQLEKMKYIRSNRGQCRIPKGHVRDRSPNNLAWLMVEHWGEEQCIINTINVLKDIPRNDKNTVDLITPFLQKIEEAW